MPERLDQLDGPTTCNRSRGPEADDTRDLRVRRCGACGSLLFSDVDAEPSSSCPECEASAALGWPKRRSTDFRCPCCLDSGVVEVRGLCGAQAGDADTQWRPCECEERVRDLLRSHRSGEPAEHGPAALAGPVRGPGWETSASARCDVCGVPLEADERDRALPTCWTCDVNAGTAIARLVMKGHSPPAS